MAFVEFRDEEAMNKALEDHADVSGYLMNWLSRRLMLLQTLNGCKPEVKQASDRESGLRGMGRQSRGRYISRGLAAAGLTRPTGGGGNDS